ncbi:MAG TPA: PKD domain-containing protein [Candidatus Saccharimonadales bacterium]|nr:PKD domain-containing protein [Candidatus Saccharimonadales bacterium]
MALQIRGTAFNSSSANGTLATVTIPAATQAGDLILEFIEVTANGLAQTAPGGWTNITALTASNSSSSLRGAQRIAQGGDANTVASFTLNTTGRWAITLIVLYDDAGGTARIEQLTQATAGNTTAPQTPAIDPQNTNDILLAIMSGTASTVAVQPVYSAGATTAMQVQATSTSGTLRNASIGIAARTLTDGNALGAITHSVTQTITPASASVLISNQNVGPVANAGTDQAVNPGVTVTLDGTASSDFDGTITGYSWSQTSGTAVTLSSSAVAQPTFTSPVSVNGATLVFSLTVSDNESATSAPDTVTVTVGASPNQQVWMGGSMQKQPVRHWVGGAWVA